MSDQTSLISPTKNLSNPISSFLNSPKNSSKSQSSCNKSEAEAIGLALVDSLNEEKSDGSFWKPINRMGLFGSKLKEVQIPVINPSPADLSRQLSLKEMEVSEDYTRVILHGPNPKTTHIFHNCIVESCCGEDDKKIECGFKSNFCKDNLEPGKDA